MGSQLLERLDALEQARPPRRGLFGGELRNPADMGGGIGGIDPPAPDALVFSADELENARLSPPCIVESYLFADVAVLAAPGGTGKTTQLVYEAVCIALGRDVWGLPTRKPGWTLIVTAEDSREIFAARLREVVRHMALTEEERRVALASVRVWDVSGEGRKLVRVMDGNLILTPLADQIVNAYRADPPAMAAFDPLVSFGADESRVNDNEQAIVTAARRIVRGLGCCVRLVHHVGKASARERTLDQYTGRGGSALADGARMVAVLQPWDASQREPLPEGCAVGQGSSVVAMARPKLSYAPPNPPLIFIRRTGWTFEHFTQAPRKPKGEARSIHADQLERFLASELGQGRRHNKATLESLCGDLDMTRQEIREALAALQISARVVEADLPASLRKGRKQTFLCPSNSAEGFGDIGPETGEDATPEDPMPLGISISPPYREMNGGDIAAPFVPSAPSITPNSNGDIGGIGGIGGIDENEVADIVTEDF